MKHLAQRQKESPDYYERLPELNGRTGWQQLDTTLCMRVLLDPEKDAARPLDLLGNTPHPAAARRACNAVRMARNEAAHASDRTAAAQAAIRFNEAVEELEAGYEGTALTTGDLEKYYRMAEDFLSRCGASETIEPQKKAEDEAPRRQKSQKSGSTSRKRQSGGSRTISKGHQAAAGIPLAGTAAAARICRPRPAARSVSAPRAAPLPWCCWPSSCWACWSGHGRWADEVIRSTEVDYVRK